MPIDYKKYPSNWDELRNKVLARAKNCCEICGVKNYAVGTRINGEFIPTAGNILHDKAGAGQLSFKEAKALQAHCNEMCDDELIIIVLTIAHLDHDVDNADVSIDRLQALCQYHHLKYDAKEKSRKRKLAKKQIEIKF